MAKNPIHSLLLVRRAYSVAVETVKVQKSAAVYATRKVSDFSGIRKERAAAAEAEEGGGTNNSSDDAVFWMRNPRTGNWMPENHFDEVDAAELRHKHCLSKKQLY